MEWFQILGKLLVKIALQVHMEYLEHLHVYHVDKGCMLLQMLVHVLFAQPDIGIYSFNLAFTSFVYISVWRYAYWHVHDYMCMIMHIVYASTQHVHVGVNVHACMCMHVSMCVCVCAGQIWEVMLDAIVLTKNIHFIRFVWLHVIFKHKMNCFSL